MGIGNIIKRAFGFGGDVSEQDGFYSDDADTSVTVNAISSPDINNAVPSQDVVACNSDGKSGLTKEANAATTQIFDSVLSVFNESLPDFLKRSVDPEAQKLYLYDKVDSGVKEYLRQLEVQANEKSEHAWNQRQRSMKTEIESYKEKVRNLEEKQNEAKQAQLSAERQKRALSERVHDLESKVLKLEADCEQYDLEKKSLMNKLKVASVKEDDIEAMRNENQDLRLQLIAARQNKQETISAEEDSPDTELQKKVDELERQNDEYSKTLRAMSVEDSQSQLAAETLRQQLALSANELQATREALDSAKEELAIADEIQAEIDKFEDIKKRQDNRISTLKKQNKQLNDKVVEYEAEMRLLREELEGIKRSTYANNPEDVVEASGDSDLQDDIEQDMVSPPISADAIFETALDDTAWVMEVPETVETPAKASDDFGYKPPKKKPAPPADDASQQLSLW